MGNCEFGAVTSVFVGPVSPPKQTSMLFCAKGWFGSIVPIEYCRLESQLMGEKPPLESSFSDSASQIKLQSSQLKSFGFDKIGHSL